MEYIDHHNTIERLIYLGTLNISHFQLLIIRVRPVFGMPCNTKEMVNGEMVKYKCAKLLFFVFVCILCQTEAYTHLIFRCTLRNVLSLPTADGVKLRKYSENKPPAQIIDPVLQE